jgi:aspartate/glutamate racemase
LHRVGSETATRYPARVIGIRGGTGRESTAEYYRPVDEMVRDRLGGPHSP